ncbi:hypothetical protein [Alkalihalobacillus alcalophilus]|uniref:hypothetical protein n=1 Tax=Alkalihalobacillus alcalophilus TaxID=1445 RepID=UPI00027BCC6F|nr:hypothetical protein [Alkalihalobacillus alcalophilus]
MTKKLELTALKRAMVIQRSKLGLIHHFDRGSQFTLKKYLELFAKGKSHPV